MVDQTEGKTGIPGRLREMRSFTISKVVQPLSSGSSFAGSDGHSAEIIRPNTKSRHSQENPHRFLKRRFVKHTNHSL